VLERIQALHQPQLDHRRPQEFRRQVLRGRQSRLCIIPPNSFALARTVEYFRIPRNVLTICLGKSTYARCGIIVNVTPLEPEWEGHVTLEFSNTTPLPAKIYANEGVAQVIFIESDEVCETSYRDRGGSTRDRRASPCPRSEQRGRLPRFLLRSDLRAYHMLRSTAAEASRRGAGGAENAENSA